MLEQLLLVPILVPLGAGILILIVPRAGRWTGPVLSLAATAASFAASLLLFLNGAPALNVPLFALGALRLGVHLALVQPAPFILLFAGGFAFLVCLYSVGYRRSDRGGSAAGYYAFTLLAAGGAAGVLLADHFLVFLVAWEIVTVSLYFLITTGGSESRVGATKTFATLGAADGCLLAGIGILWFLTDTLRIGETRVAVTGWLSGAAFVLILIGALAKAGAVPFHSWIPAASDGAPAPVMALLPAAVDKLLGIYLLVRLVMPGTGLFVPTPGLSLALMILGAFTIVVAVMIAMVQHDLRRLLAYHAISQVGYMVLGIGTLTIVGIAGGLFHMINNAVYKSCLFLCAGSVERKTGTTDLAQLGGLAGAMPLTFAAALVSALAISGVPPLNGFVSKWLIYQGIIDSPFRGSPVILAAAMFGSALTLASFVKVIYSVFLGRRTERTRTVAPGVGFAMAVPVAVLALLCVVAGVAYRLPLRALIEPGLGLQVAPAGFWRSGLATGLIGVGLLAGLAIYLLGRVGRSARTVPGFIGGEEIDETGRVPGTHFYETIRLAPGLKGLYAAQAAGKLDPFAWVGGLGHAVTRGLQALHNGLLSWYLSWSLVGAAALIALLVLLV